MVVSGRPSSDPKTFCTVSVTVTRNRVGWPSTAVTTAVEAAASSKPLRLAKSLAVVKAPVGSPGSWTTPARAPASAARCIWWPVRYQRPTSTENAASANRTVAIRATNSAA